MKSPIKSMQIGDIYYEARLREMKDPFWKFGGPPTGNKKPIWEALKEGAWSGEECFVIGGGSSLQGFDFERIRGKGRVIVCNKGFLYTPFADLMVAMDNDFYNDMMDRKLSEPRLGMRGGEIRKRFLEFGGWKVWVDMSNYAYDRIHFVYKRNDPHIGKMIDGIYSGNNVGVGGLSMAATLGCNPIYLLGYDMYHVGKRTHFHGGYERKQVESHLRSFMAHFKRISPDLKRRGFVIYNLNPKSKLRDFPRRRVEEIIGGEV